MAEHKASCQCGQFSVAASADPDFVIVCNCRACQKRSGSPMGEAGYFRREQVTVEGAHKTWARRAESGREVVVHFCPECGTNLFWSLEMRPDHLGVAAGCFDTEVPAPARAIWAAHKHDWVRFPEDWPVFDKGTPGT